MYLLLVEKNKMAPSLVMKLLTGLQQKYFRNEKMLIKTIVVSGCSLIRKKLKKLNEKILYMKLFHVAIMLSIQLFNIEVILD